MSFSFEMGIYPHIHNGEVPPLAQEKTIDAIVVGGINRDYSLHLAETPVMHTSNPVKINVSDGGVARNVAVNLARLGARVRMLARIGDDATSRAVAERLSRDLDARHLEMVTNASMDTYIAALEPNGHLQIGYAGMSLVDGIDAAWLDARWSEATAADWWVVDTNVNREAVAAMRDAAVRHGKNLAILGVSGPKTKNIPEDLNGVSMVIVNVDESQAAFRTDEADPLTLCRLWLDRGAARAVVTAGDAPGAYGDANGVESYFVPEVTDIRSVTGAGDAFSAGVLRALMKNNTLREACAVGARCAVKTLRTRESVAEDLTWEAVMPEERIER